MRAERQTSRIAPDRLTNRSCHRTEARTISLVEAHALDHAVRGRSAELAAPARLQMEPATATARGRIT